MFLSSSDNVVFVAVVVRLFLILFFSWLGNDLMAECQLIGSMEVFVFHSSFYNRIYFLTKLGEKTYMLKRHPFTLFLAFQWTKISYEFTLSNHEIENRKMKYNKAKRDAIVVVINCICCFEPFIVSI